MKSALYLKQGITTVPLFRRYPDAKLDRSLRRIPNGKGTFRTHISPGSANDFHDRRNSATPCA